MRIAFWVESVVRGNRYEEGKEMRSSDEEMAGSKR
jgi:hypothetical protein